MKTKTSHTTEEIAHVNRINAELLEVAKEALRVFEELNYGEAACER